MIMMMILTLSSAVGPELPVRRTLLFMINDHFARRARRTPAILRPAAITLILRAVWQT